MDTEQKSLDQQKSDIEGMLGILRESLIEAGGRRVESRPTPQYHIPTSLVYYNVDRVTIPEHGLAVLFDNGQPFAAYYNLSGKLHRVEQLTHDIDGGDGRKFWHELNRRFDIKILDETPYEGALGGRAFLPNGPLIHIEREKTHQE